MSKTDKGLKSISIDFAGEKRTLKWTHAAIGEFEADGNMVLRTIGTIPQGHMEFADRLISIWLNNAKILSFALFHALGKAVKSSEIDEGIDAYIQAGGKKEDLVRAITRAFLVATDPNSLASQERNWNLSDRRKKYLSDLENKQSDAIEKALQEVKETLTPGSPMPASPS